MTPAPPLLHVLETVLYARDLDAMRRFYVEVVGLTLLSAALPRGMAFRVGAGDVLLVFDPDQTINPSASGLPSHGAFGPGHAAFRIEPETYEAWKAHLAAMGVAIEREHTWPSGVRSIYVRDPALNTIEFMAGDDWARYET